MGEGDDISPTFQAAGYDWEDWLSVFESFEEHPDLEPNRKPDLDIDQYLTHPEMERGGSPIYRIESTSGEFHLEYSPRKRKEEDEMLTGFITFNGDIHGEIIEQKYQVIVEFHRTEYISPRRGNRNLARINIPENYDGKLIEETVQSGIDIVKDTIALQKSLENVISEYEPSA